MGNGLYETYIPTKYTMPNAYTKVRTYTHRHFYMYRLYLFSACIFIVILLLLPLAPLFASELDTQGSTLPDALPEAITQNIDDTTMPVVTDEQPAIDTTPTSTDIIQQNEPISNDTTPPLPDPDPVSVSDQTVTEESLPLDTATNIEIIQYTDETTVSPRNAESVEVSASSSVMQPEIQNEYKTPTNAVTSQFEDSNLKDTQKISTATATISTISTISTSTVTQGDYISEVTNDENRFSFSKSECTLVGDEIFYCAKQSAKQTTESTNDRVFAEADAQGDKEIYIEKDEKRTQITSNIYDDDAPSYDQVSNIIVWHRLIDGRYQIISYNIDDNKETQITSDRFNNMYANRYGNVTVWQGWVGNDWDIFMLDGDTVKMITDNTIHDVSPRINGDHIIWQSFVNDVWVMQVYDIRTGKIKTAEGAQGSSIQNPRFVLVYDTKDNAGDVETRGFDLESGETVHLASTPAPVPEKLPDPEQTGEERALVAPTTHVKSKISDGDDIPDDDTDTTSTSTVDIVVPAFTETIASTTESTTTEIFDNASTTTDEIFIPNDASTLSNNASSTSHIEDVIVTPYTEPINITE